MKAPYLRILTNRFDARELLSYDPVGAAADVLEILDRHNVRVEPMFTGRDLASLHDEFQDVAQRQNKAMTLLAMPEGMTKDAYEALLSDLVMCRHITIALQQDTRVTTLPPHMYKNEVPKPTDW